MWVSDVEQYTLRHTPSIKWYPGYISQFPEIYKIRYLSIVQDFFPTTSLVNILQIASIIDKRVVEIYTLLLTWVCEFYFV